MGLRSWFRRFTNKIKKIRAAWFHMSRFRSIAFFDDGACAVWQGRPAGAAYRKYEELVRDAVYVKNTLDGDMEEFRD